MSIVDLEQLFKPRLPEDDVEVPGVGVVRVRGLSRLEAMSMKSVTDPGESERQMMALGMVQPKMTVADVRRWQAASPAGEIEEVSRRIGELSGMIEGADKEAYKSLPDGPDA